MGIFEMTDSFCNLLNTENQMNSIKNEIKLGNKIHEQPIVSFIENENEQDVIYREEM